MDHRLEVAGLRLEVARHGPPAAERTLVFLHEGLGCVSLWRTFPQRLSEATGWSSLVYSRAGYGRSDGNPPPWPVTFLHQEAALLPQVLEAAGVGEHVLIGHSDGGSLALIHAGSPSTRGLLGVVTLAAHVFVEDLTIQSIERAERAFRTGDLRARLARHHGENVDDAFGGFTSAWLDPAFRAWTITDSLPRVRVPVLALQGEDDEYGTSAQTAAIVAGAPRAEALTVPGGHALHREQEALLVETIAAFVRGVAAPPDQGAPPSGSGPAGPQGG